MDDFAFKKRHTYGTIIVDEATHKPVAILDGRDGKTLKEWLSKNKHVKAVTRDRASAYSAAIKVSQTQNPKTLPKVLMTYPISAPQNLKQSRLSSP